MFVCLFGLLINKHFFVEVFVKGCMQGCHVIRTLYPESSVEMLGKTVGVFSLMKEMPGNR